MIKVLFVCMGNICRSPMAQGAFEKVIKARGLSDKVSADSAGTLSYHNGNPPDERAIKTASEHGVDISTQRSRLITAQDFDEFDYILVMDNENMEDIQPIGGEKAQSAKLFLSYAKHIPMAEMPDPYRGHIRDFEVCFFAAQDAAEDFMDTLIRDHDLAS